MGHATIVVFILAVGSCLDLAGACHPGLKCHFGADYEALGEWAKTNVCPSCVSLINCTDCEPHNADLNCDHPACGDRRAQLLLQHPPVDCSSGFTEVWETLHRQCARIQDRCCNRQDCPRPNAKHCGLQFKSADQYAASLYIGIATLAGSLALLREDATTIKTSASTTQFLF